MSYDFFKVPEKKSPKPEKEMEKEKEECPYCGKQYVSVARHLPHCDKNPDNLEREREEQAVSKAKPQVAVNETELRKEIREELLKELKKEERDLIPQLTEDEKEKIEDVQKFLGGTEGYQFIYKTITGDKIRGKMTEIIDECITWLKKHKAYLLWYK